LIGSQYIDLLICLVLLRNLDSEIRATLLSELVMNLESKRHKPA
jgi:hypothetical protein